MAARIPFADEFDAPTTLVPVLLIAGVPLVITAEGLHPVAVAWSGTPDPAFWPGSGSLTQSLPTGDTFDPVRDWIDTRVPLRVSAQVDPVKGDVSERSVAFDLSDPDGAATRWFSARDAYERTLLAQELGPSDTDVFVDTYEPFGSTGGYATVGRETFTYTGRGSAGGAHLTGAVRGKYGSKARLHRAPSYRRPTVAAGVRYLYGRRATVWIARYDATTGELQDPTLWFDGTVGNGTELVANGTRWHITIDPSSAMLTSKVQAPSVSLFGWNYTPRPSAFPPGEPLNVSWGASVVSLRPSSAFYDNGWKPSRSEFIRAWQNEADALGAALYAIYSDDRLTIEGHGATGGADADLDVIVCWDDPARSRTRVTAGDEPSWRSTHPMPEVCVWLHGWVTIAAPGEWERIPSVLSYADGDSTARWALVAKTDERDEVVADLLERDATNTRVRVLPHDVGDAAADQYAATMITRRTTATLALTVSTGAWWHGIRTAIAAIASEFGADHLDDAVDWDWIRDQVRAFPSPFPTARRYRFAFEDSLLEPLVQEARLAGFVLTRRRGRIAMVRLAGFASTELASRSITSADATGPISVKECASGLLSGMELERSGDRQPLRVLDVTAQDEFGDGVVVKVRDLGIEAAGATEDHLAQGLVEVSQLIIGPYSEPYHLVNVPLGPTFYDLEPGDLVSLTHPLVPATDGTRGVSGLLCQVVDAERGFAGGEASVRAALRIPEQDLCGWAPEAPVAAGGISGAAVTLDNTTDFGPSAFAPDTDGEGNPVTDAGASWFGAARSGANAVVVLSQFGVASPIPDEMFTVLSVAGPVLTLSGSPSASMVAAATGALGVLVRFAGYDDATASRQHEYAFIADAAAGVIPAGGANPYRWAA